MIKTIPIRHLNGSKLHLNKRGTEILLNMFIESISNNIHWQSNLHSPGNCLVDEYDANNLVPKKNLVYFASATLIKLLLLIPT